jgi:ribosome-binding protein aMBF1 (putative translation factor)
MDYCDYCNWGFKISLQVIKIDGEKLKVCPDCYEKESDTGGEF